MVQGNPDTNTPAMTTTEAELALKVSLTPSPLLFVADRKKGTFSKDKHEILFQRFKINYDKEDEIWKKGSVVYRKVRSSSSVYCLMLTRIDSSRTSKRSKKQHWRRNLFHRQTTKERKSLCQEHKWRRKERGKKKPGS